VSSFAGCITEPTTYCFASWRTECRRLNGCIFCQRVSCNMRNTRTTIIFCVRLGFGLSHAFRDADIAKQPIVRAGQNCLP
jgi:hypothetical protein